VRLAGFRISESVAPSGRAFAKGRPLFFHSI
jgi:hypothetical protein